VSVREVEWLRELEVAVTVSVQVPFGVPGGRGGGLPPPPQADHISTSSKAVARHHHHRRRTLVANLPINMSPNKNMNHNRISGFPKVGGIQGHPSRGKPAPRAVVVTLTATWAGLVPSGVTEEGVREQVEAEGAPLQERETD
jgi:hypothetical protein